MIYSLTLSIFSAPGCCWPSFLREKETECGGGVKSAILRASIHFSVVLRDKISQPALSYWCPLMLGTTAQGPASFLSERMHAFCQVVALEATTDLVYLQAWAPTLCPRLYPSGPPPHNLAQSSGSCRAPQTSHGHKPPGGWKHPLTDGRSGQGPRLYVSSSLPCEVGAAGCWGWNVYAKSLGTGNLIPKTKWRSGGEAFGR